MIYIYHIIIIFFDIILFKRVFPYQVHHLVRGILIRLEIGLHPNGFEDLIYHLSWESEVPPPKATPPQ